MSEVSKSPDIDRRTFAKVATGAMVGAGAASLINITGSYAFERKENKQAKLPEDEGVHSSRKFTVTLLATLFGAVGGYAFDREREKYLEEQRDIAKLYERANKVVEEKSE